MTNKVDLKQDKLSAKILFVDDEINILSSLKRLFRPIIDKVYTAQSGAEGLEILNSEPIDIVVSDMRMPQMDGAQFLEQVAEKWPRTIRILLTGYADITSTINAINKGSIYRYVSKPWEDNDFTLTVRQALESKQLKEERDQLLILTNKQNNELKDLNANLETKVKARTEEVQQTMAQLEITHESLKKSYDTTIKVFSNIIELREGGDSSESIQVADLAINVAKKLGVSNDNVQQIYFASLLRNLGKIGFSDELNSKPFDTLNNNELEKVKQHPIIGQGILMALDYLQVAANIIRNQRERFDGQGFPDALQGEDIPLGARIIAVVSDYYACQVGLVSSKRLSEADTREYINRNRSMRYDPGVVDALFEILDVTDIFRKIQNIPKEDITKSKDLKEGMILSRDLVLNNGVVLLSKGHLLNSKLVIAIQKMEHKMKENMIIHVAYSNGEY